MAIDTSTKSVRSLCRELRSPNSSKADTKMADLLDALLDERFELEELALSLVESRSRLLLERK